MAELEAVLAARPLLEGERVLAVSRMHGARHRLNERLGRGPARGRFDCMTIDSLAWRVVGRWRSLVADLGLSEPSEQDFDETCATAAKLLGEPFVARWLAHQYPIIVVDEFQDCREGRLGIVQELAKVSETLLAADDFQDLSGEAECVAVAWLRASLHPEELDRVFRTSNADLLGAARAVRDGQPLKCGFGSGFSLVAAPNANVAAGHLARQIAWSGGGELVVLTPTGPWKSPFVRDALARVAQKPMESKKGPPRGPYRVAWQHTTAQAEEDLVAALSLPMDPRAVVPTPTFASDARLAGRSEVERWLEMRRRLRGQVSFESGEIRAAVTRATQQHRAHARPPRHLRAMTIQQAKNQEFEQVVVLWPFQVQGDAEKLRRLLYNAITRARAKAIVIVQDPKGERLSKAPFG
jgi:hypothetical protein